MADMMNFPKRIDADKMATDELVRVDCFWELTPKGE